MRTKYPTFTSQPEEILPTGLDAQRHRYLYEKIRPFCSSNLRADISCPKPLMPKPNSQRQAQATSSIQAQSTQQNRGNRKAAKNAKTKEHQREEGL